MFLKVNQFVTFHSAWKMFFLRCLIAFLVCSSRSRRRVIGGRVCVDVWRAVWAVVDADCRVQARVMLPRHYYKWMDCIYIALFCNQWPPKALYDIAWHSYTVIHTFTHNDGGVRHAKRQPARREQRGLGALLRDSSTLELGGARDRTSNHTVTIQPALPPELLPLPL